ncbi:MAG: NAD-dependent malic enzyme [Candidatus Spechtbacterales bacterium]|nr:NAD-dependent malic enzyme [Candidatus Spechtbacterales bacterium]
MRQNIPLTMRLKIQREPGTLGVILSRLSRYGATVQAVDIVEASDNYMVRDITVSLEKYNEKELRQVVEQNQKAEVLYISDRILLAHLGGKIETGLKAQLRNREDLSTFYTPGVGRVCMSIHDNPKYAHSFTIKRNTVAVVTDGTAVLGLGDIGPEASLPVMEGKAMLFKEFGGVDAFPIALDTKDTEEIIKHVKAIAPVFGGINLEDISAPRCFEIEERLKRELDIPVFHDDQHGTAVVAFAGLLNALKIVGKDLSDLKVVISGVGAAGVATAKMLLTAGCKNIVGCDSRGAIWQGRQENMNGMKEWFSKHTNPLGSRGDVQDQLRGADLFIGLSAPDLIKPEHVASMAKDPIIFAMANPVPEIMPEDAAPHARIIATGRSDYPNQINNVLCFPGLFRGALDVQANDITEEMKFAAAKAIASVISDSELSEDYIIPSVFNKDVARVVADAVADVAYKTGVARKERKTAGSNIYSDPCDQ